MPTPHHPTQHPPPPPPHPTQHPHHQTQHIPPTQQQPRPPAPFSTLRRPFSPVCRIRAVCPPRPPECRVQPAASGMSPPIVTRTTWVKPTSGKVSADTKWGTTWSKQQLIRIRIIKRTKEIYSEKAIADGRSRGGEVARVWEGAGLCGGGGGGGGGWVVGWVSYCCVLLPCVEGLPSIGVAVILLLRFRSVVAKITRTINVAQTEKIQLILN